MIVFSLKELCRWFYILPALFIFFMQDGPAQTAEVHYSPYEQVARMVCQLDIDTAKPYLVVGYPASHHIEAGRLSLFWKWLSSSCMNGQVPIAIVTSDYRSSLLSNHIHDYFMVDTSIICKSIASTWWYERISPTMVPFIHYYDPSTQEHYRTSLDNWAYIKTPMQKICYDNQPNSVHGWFAAMTKKFPSVNFILQSVGSYLYIVPVENWKIYGFDVSSSKSFEIDMELLYDEWFTKQFLGLPTFQVDLSEYGFLNDLLEYKGFKRYLAYDVTHIDESLIVVFYSYFGRNTIMDNGEEVFLVTTMRHFARVADSNLSFLGYDVFGIPNEENPAYSLRLPVTKSDTSWIFYGQPFYAMDTIFSFIEMKESGVNELLDFSGFLSGATYGEKEWSSFLSKFVHTIPLGTDTTAILFSDGEGWLIDRQDGTWRVADSIQVEVEEQNSIDIHVIEKVHDMYWWVIRDENCACFNLYTSTNLTQGTLELKWQFPKSLNNAGHITIMDSGVCYAEVDYYATRLQCIPFEELDHR